MMMTIEQLLLIKKIYINICVVVFGVFKCVAFLMCCAFYTSSGWVLVSRRKRVSVVADVDAVIVVTITAGVVIYVNKCHQAILQPSV